MRHEPVFARYLTEAEERQLLRHVGQFRSLAARRDHAWMRLLRRTGIRVSTLAGLTCGDARDALRTGYLTVRGAIAKRGCGYRLHLTKRARGDLRALLALRREQGVAEQPEAPLILSRHRRGIAVRTLQDRMQRWVRDAGLQCAATPHWFRHTLAKRIVKRSTAQDPRGVVQSVLGHRSTRSTDVYTRPDREDVVEAMEEVA